MRVIIMLSRSRVVVSKAERGSGGIQGLGLNEYLPAGGLWKSYPSQERSSAGRAGELR